MHAAQTRLLQKLMKLFVSNISSAVGNSLGGGRNFNTRARKHAPNKVKGHAPQTRADYTADWPRVVILID